MRAPHRWYNDEHDPSEDQPKSARCCQAISAVETTLRAIGGASEKIAGQIARAVVNGMLGVGA
jgi:hypothetical protein